MLGATSSSSSAPAPTRPPTKAFQAMATSQRGPENQCVSVKKQLEEEGTSHALSLTPPTRGGPLVHLDLPPCRQVGRAPS